MPRKARPVRYALLVYADEEAWEMAAPEALEKPSQASVNFREDMGPRIVSREELEPTSTATTVRIEGPGGDAIVTDGAFADSKEQLAGFYVVECEDLDEAIQFAASVLGASFGTIEVRPVVQGAEPC